MECQPQHLTTLWPQKRLLVQRASQPRGAIKIKSKSGGSGGGDDQHANWEAKEEERTVTLSSWNMRRNVPDTVSCPSWNTNAKAKVNYNPMVMVGNWAEDRLRKDYASKLSFLKENVPKHPSDYGVAKSEALRTRMKNEGGVSSDYMFKQHDTLYDHNQITMYDENYNQRWREKKLPKMRHWNFAHLAWLPENSDHPLFGPSTQFGLFDTLKEKWEKDVGDKRHTYNTIYRSKYLSKSADYLLPPHTTHQSMSYAHFFPRPDTFLRRPYINPLRGSRGR